MSLTFTEENHVYKYDGVVVPSVTQVLSPLIDYSMVPDFKMAVARDRGTNVHKMCQLHDYGLLEDFDQDYLPYLEAWIKFLRDSGFESEVIEPRMYHPRFKYAGEPDRIGWCKKKHGVLDLKITAKLMPAVGPQTAAYLEMWNHQHPDTKIKYRWVALLKPDGTYVFETLSGVNDFSVFTSCLNIHRWKQKNNVQE